MDIDRPNQWISMPQLFADLDIFRSNLNITSVLHIGFVNESRSTIHARQGRKYMVLGMEHKFHAHHIQSGSFITRI